MTKQTATKLLHEGRVELKGCKSQKTGKTYDTTVVMTVDENRRAVFRLDFDKKGEAKNGKSKDKYCLEPSLEMRRSIKKQLCIIDPKEFDVPGKRDIPDIKYKY